MTVNNLRVLHRQRIPTILCHCNDLSHTPD